MPPNLMTLDDLERQNRGFMDFLRFLSARHISRAYCAEINLVVEKLRMKFSALNADFDGPSLDFFRFTETCARGHQRAVPP